MASRVQILLFLVTLCCMQYKINGHVALTFPPARKYDLDFLDNSRTPAPCGMPKGTLRTSFLSGSTFNVTWHLAYPHRGGYKIQILDHLERPKLDLTPSIKGSEFFSNDATAQSHEIRLPENFTCDDCTLRLLRQADEWGNSYRFWSCADIDIKPRKEYRETCSGHGKYLATKCKCDKNYYGPRCQYWDECTADKDCGVQGKCIDVGGTALPRKQCYCKLGWFGPGCNKKSAIKSTDIDYSLYTTKQLTPDYKIHWRILKEEKEIEMVLQVNGTSWVGFGWRPKKLTADCRKFPVLSDPAAEPSSEPEPTSEPEPSSETTPKGEPSSEPEPKSEPEPSSEPKSEPASEPQSEPASEPKSEPASEPKSEPASEPQSKPASEPKSELASEPKSEPASEHKSEPASELEVSKKSEPLALGSSKSKRVAAPTKAIEKSAELPQIPASKDEYTVSTSVSYRVSSSAGRRRRAAEKEENMEEKLGEETTSEPESTAEPQSEPASTPEPQSEPASTPEPQSEPTSTAEPQSEPTSESSSTAEPQSEPSSSPEPKSEPSSSPEPKSEPSSTAEPKSEPSSEPSSKPEPKSEPTSEPASKTESKTEKPLLALTAKTGPKDYTPKHDFNAMDCTDIVIGTARGEMSRIWDYYTRDRSTPRMDTFYGGKSELQATGGFEKDGITTIVFRKKLDASEPTDHSITDDLMHVIWAKGQEPEKYVHFPPSGIEKEQASNAEFYQPDELKYHGHKLQRGYTQINFFDEDKPASSEVSPHELENECHGHWKTPRNCSQEKHDCEYYIGWKTVGKGDAIKFHIETTNVNTYTGVGFSDDRQMSQTDAIIGWYDSRNARPFVMDTWINGYSAPLLDDKQNIYNETGSLIDGVTTLEFVRKRMTDDKQDHSFTDEHCLYMMFLTKGGSFNSVNKKIRKHEQVPIVTDNRICIKTCGLDQNHYDTEATTPAPNRLAYAVSMKLINLADGFEPPQKGSQEYEDLSRTIRGTLDGVLGNIPGYSKLDEIQFKKNDDDVIAKMNVLFDKAMYEKGRSLDISNNKIVDEKDEGQPIEKAIRDSLATGKVGSLSVDPNFLEFEPLAIVSTEQSTADRIAEFFKLSEVRLYTVLGCIAALVLVAIIQATCTIMKASKKSKRHKLIPNQGWKEYSSNTNYAFDAHNDHDEKHNGKSRNGANSRSSTATMHNGISQQTTLQMSHSPNKSQYYDVSRNGNRYGGDHRNKNGDRHHPQQQQQQPVPTSYADRSYSLPRTMIQPHSQMAGYYTQDRRNRSSHNPNGSSNYHRQTMERSNGTDTPDFYFMPSQRKYSGEVVRVFVDYNKDPKN